MLADLGTVLGEQRRIVVARELTKIHEEFLRGTPAEILTELSKRPAVKGEMTVIVSGEVKGAAEAAASRSLIDRMRQLMTSESLDEKAALKQVAKEFGLSKSEAYREWQRRKRQ
jgi:16S rRNA (cytidine1402-2'-O)-methyltransferase